MVLFAPQPLAQILYLCTWWFHPLQLVLLVFFLPPTDADTVLALGQLALCGGVFLVVVVDVCVCGGGGGCSYGVVVVVKMYWC